MKIAMIGGFIDIPPLFGGGAESHMYGISKEMIKEGHEVTMFIGGEEERTKVVDEINIHQLKVGSFAIAPHLSRDYLLGKTAQKIIKNNNFDIVHGQVFLPAYWALNSLKTEKFEAPLVYTEHFWNTWLPHWSELKLKQKIFKPIEKIFSSKLYGLVDELIFLSENIKNEIKEKTKLDEDKISIIPHGVDTEIYNPQNEDQNIFKKWDVDDGKQKILFVGRLDPEKGVKYLLRAIKTVLKKYNVDLIIVGSSFTESEGSEESYLKQLTQGLGISNNVVFTGSIPIDELKKLFASVNIFCLPTLYEVSPMVVFEAMGSKSCVLSTTVAGIPEIVANGKDGVLVPPKDSGSLAKELINLLENKKLRDKLSENAYKKVIEKYSWRNIAKKTLRVYEEAL